MFFCVIVACFFCYVLKYVFIGNYKTICGVWFHTRHCYEHDEDETFDCRGPHDAQINYSEYVSLRDLL